MSEDSAMQSVEAMEVEASQPAQFDMSDAPSFVAEKAGLVSFWTVEESGHNETDVMRGDAMALEALRYEQDKRAGLIAVAIYTIGKNGRLGPIECGFITRIACAASVGALN